MVHTILVLSCSSTGNCLGQSDGATQVIVFDDTVYFVGPPMNPQFQMYMEQVF